MAMQTDTYANLLTRIQGLSGVDNFASSELTLVDSFINRRAYQAYRASDSWPRYLVGAEARPGPLNIIPWEYDETAGARVISSASRSGSTVTVTVSADIDGDFVSGQYVTIAGLSGSVSPNGTYQVTVSDDDVFSYELDTENTATETYTGSGTVAVVALNDIDSFIRIFASQPHLNDSASEFDFFVGSAGANVVANQAEIPGFWVTYKKRWDGPYNSTSNDDIPLEFFNFMAHAAAADFLRLNRQISAAQAEETVAEQYLALELERPQNQANNAVVARISTHTSRQAR